MSKSTSSPSTAGSPRKPLMASNEGHYYSSSGETLDSLSIRSSSLARELEEEWTASQPPGYSSLSSPRSAQTDTKKPPRKSPIAGEDCELKPSLPLSFFALLCCCCWPSFIFAIMSVIYSVQANSQVLAKDFEGARLSYGQSKSWAIAAIAVGTIFLIMMVVVSLLLLIIKNTD